MYIELFVPVIPKQNSEYIQAVNPKHIFLNHLQKTFYNFVSLHFLDWLDIRAKFHIGGYVDIQGICSEPSLIDSNFKHLQEPFSVVEAL